MNFENLQASREGSDFTIKLEVSTGSRCLHDIMSGIPRHKRNMADATRLPCTNRANVKSRSEFSLVFRPQFFGLLLLSVLTALRVGLAHPPCFGLKRCLYCLLCSETVDIHIAGKVLHLGWFVWSSGVFSVHADRRLSSVKF